MFDIDSIIKKHVAEDGSIPVEAVAKLAQAVNAGILVDEFDPEIRTVGKQLGATSGGIYSDIVGAFSGIWDDFLSIGGNIVKGIWDGVSGAWDSFMGWLNGKVGGIVNGVKAMLGIHSPSTVFAGIGENMALGLAEGWDDQYSSIKRKIERGMNFSPATAGVSGLYGGTYGGQSNAQAGRSAAGNTFHFTFNSPKALDPVSAAREARKAAQQIALAYV